MSENNGEILNVAQLIKEVMTLSAEAEIRAMFINAREALPQRITLTEMVHPQPITPIKTYNLAAHSVVTKFFQPRGKKAMDMRLDWLRCREAKDQFRYYRKPGTANLG